MRLTDVMSGMDLSVYPQIGLVIFLAVFAVVTLRLLGRDKGRALQRHASMPLDEDKEQ